MDRIVVQVFFERLDLPHRALSFVFAVDAPRPGDVLVNCRVVAAQMIVNEHSQTFMIVTQQCVGAGRAPDLQRMLCGFERQRQHGNCLQRLGVLRQSSVVRDERNVESQVQSDGARIAKTSSGNKCDVHAIRPRLVDRGSIAIRDLAVPIEQSAIQIQSQKTYRHKDKQGNGMRGRRQKSC